MEKTAEEFFREKIRSKYELRGEMKALRTYLIDSEDALRWAHEFANQDKWISCDHPPMLKGDVWLTDGVNYGFGDYNSQRKGGKWAISGTNYFEPLFYQKLPELPKVIILDLDEIIKNESAE